MPFSNPFGTYDPIFNPGNNPFWQNFQGPMPPTPTAPVVPGGPFPIPTPTQPSTPASKDDAFRWTDSIEFGGTDVANITIPQPKPEPTQTNQPDEDPLELNQILQKAGEAVNNPLPLPSPFDNHPPDPGLPHVPPTEEDQGTRIPEIWG